MGIGHKVMGLGGIHVERRRLGRLILDKVLGFLDPLSFKNLVARVGRIENFFDIFLSLYVDQTEVPGRV